MIEQMAKALAKILFNKEAGHQEEALKEIENTLDKTVGIDSVLLDTFSIDDIAEILGISKDKSSGSMKCILAARLLKVKAELLSNADDDTSLKYYHKALGLYLRGLLNIGYTEIDLTDYITDVKTIHNKLQSVASTEDIYLLFTFYNSIEQYNRAVDLMFMLKSMNYPDVQNIGLNFFMNLKLIDEAVLNKCDLTKEKTLKSAEEFMKI